MRPNRGFTLIELMIAVAVVAILAGIALPSYNDYVRRGRITDATSVLSSMRVRMEQYYQDNRTYAAACNAGSFAAPPTAASNPHASFVFSCPTANATQYQVVASGVRSMSSFAYSINQSNQRTTTQLPAGWSTTNAANCWVLKKDGSC